MSNYARKDIKKVINFITVEEKWQTFRSPPAHPRPPPASRSHRNGVAAIKNVAVFIIHQRHVPSFTLDISFCSVPSNYFMQMPTSILVS
jgi:hypothetical protein